MNKDTYHQTYSKEQAINSSVDSKLIQRLFTYLSPYRKYLGICLIAMVISKAIEAIVPISLGVIAQEILKVPLSIREFSLSSYLTHIIYNCLEIILILIISYFFESFNVIVRNWVGQKALYTLRTDVFNHIQSLPLTFFDKTPIGRLMTRTIHDVDQIDQMFSESLIPILGNLLLYIFIFIGIIWLDWQIALLSACFLPIIWFLANRFRIHQKYCYDMVRSILSGMNGFIQEHLMGASTIRYFGLQKKEKKKFEMMNEDYRVANMQSIKNFASFIANIELIHNLMLIFVFITLVLFATSTTFEAGIFFTFSLYALMIFRPIADLAERYNVLQSAMSAARRIFDILDSPIEVIKKSVALSIGEIQSITFDNVWFAYEKENWILKGLSFEIKKEQTTAIVGMTGAGKSSVIQLLLRLYDYQKGTIAINGRSIQEYSLDDLRSKFSVVLQDPYIFSTSIVENIALYQNEVNEKQILSAINYVGFQPFVDRFSDGLQHVLAERGTGLSVGEMQILSLARAVAQDREFFILDEATASIDVETEKNIQNSLEKIFSQKTSLVIAHRLFTIQQADQILVLHQGVIRESGTHQQLLSKGGIYEKLHRLQFKNSNSG